jgi:putative endonuclease
MYFTYILKSCNDGKLYTGSTENVETRLKKHNAGSVPSTRDRRPFELHAYLAFNSKKRALDFEKYLKTGSGKAFLSKRVL